MTRENKNPQGGRKVTCSGLSEMARRSGNITFNLMYFEEAKKLSHLPGNRNLNESHVNDFVKILKETRFDNGNRIAFRTSLIVVNTVNNHIIDGQHRRAAFVKAIEEGIIPRDCCIIVAPVEYKTMEEEFDAVQKHNENSKNWTLNDYIQAYATQNENYKRLTRFCEDHELCHNKNGKPQFSYGIAIIGGNNRTASKYGNFTVTDDQLSIAHNIHEELVALRHRFGLSNDHTIVPMAEKWREYRHKFNMRDIKKYDLPATVLQLPKATKRNWDVVFATLFQYYDNKHKKGNK